VLSRGTHSLQLPRRAVLGAVVGAVAAAACASAVAASGTSARPLAHVSTPRAAVATTLPHTLLNDLAVVRAAVRRDARGAHGRRNGALASESLPAWLSAKLAAGTGPFAGVGAEPQLATYVQPSPSVGLWVVPATTGLCDFVPRPLPGEPSHTVGGCDTTATVVAGQDIGEIVPPGGTPIVIGLAPDGISSVLVRNQDGTTQTATVVNNTYAVTGDDEYIELTLQGTGAAAGHVISISPPQAPAGG
jgi:hypothetical protein